MVDPEALDPMHQVAPPGVRTIGPRLVGATRVVLVRHGEAVCNVSGVVGGRRGCTGLTERGSEQVAALAERLAITGELAGVTALYASVLPRALETAAILAPALDRWRDGPPLSVVADCGLCELHPGDADAMTWRTFADTYGEPDWDLDPSTPVAPGGESWTGFVARAAGALRAIAEANPGGLVVVACHAGVIEASLLDFLPVDRAVPRLKLRTEHASLTEWEHAEGRFALGRYNDVTPTAPSAP